MVVMEKKGLFFLVFLLLVLNVLSWNFLFFLREDEWKITFFDVGQGDAVLVRTPRNHHILIDGGPSDKVLEKLGNEIPFFYDLDLVILSHAHYDHVSGVIRALDHYDAENIICTGAFSESDISKKWREVLEKEGYKQALAGKRVSGKDFHMDILYPEEDLKGKEVNDLNEVSVVSRLVTEEEKSFLFMGDVYVEQEEELLSQEKENIDSDVLKVGHHGSRTSTSEEFLSAVSPEVAVIMAGEDNPYGHPHEEVVERIEKEGITLKRTDEDGDIVFREL